MGCSKVESFIVSLSSRNPTPSESGASGADGDGKAHWPVFNGTRHVFQIKKTSEVTSQLDVTPLYSIWDDIYNCLKNFVCDKPIWNGTSGGYGGVV